jgi:hypothetical protein
MIEFAPKMKDLTLMLARIENYPESIDRTEALTKIRHQIELLKKQGLDSKGNA